MRKTIRIEVTAEDIAKGRRQSACACPIALAMERVGACPVVGTDAANISFGYRRFDHVELPPEATEFITKFDDGDTSVRPFSFDLELP